jgi:ribosomal protein S18 acetylase RimI-like enzyme
LSSKRGHITDAYIDLDFRRKGILRKLEEYALTELKVRGIEIVELNVRIDNDEGLSTWKALDYKIKKRIKGINADKFTMIKEIG